MKEHESIKRRIGLNIVQLNERQTRIYLTSEAVSYGWGGITLISRLSGVSSTTVQLGIKESNKEVETAASDRIRRAGAGRKKEKDRQQRLEKAILDIVESRTVGDPMRVIIRTGKSSGNIQTKLHQRGYKASCELIRQILQENEYSMQSNRKTREGGTHPDRDTQFEFIQKVAFIYFK
jgi:hypothetical protein